MINVGPEIFLTFYLLSNRCLSKVDATLP